MLLLALGLRLVNLGGRTLWYDEAFAVLFAEQGLDAMRAGTLEQVDGSAADVHPLLYYATLHGWMDVCGQSAAAVRLYSALVGVLSVAVIYGLARDWFGESTARAAALIAAVAPFHVQYSQEARMYALLGLALLLTTWAYWRAWQGRRPAWWIVFGVLAGISMYRAAACGAVLLALGLLPVLYRDGHRLARTVGGRRGARRVSALDDQPARADGQAAPVLDRPNVLHLWLALRSFVSVNLDFSRCGGYRRFCWQRCWLCCRFTGRGGRGECSRLGSRADGARLDALAGIGSHAAHGLRPMCCSRSFCRARAPSALIFYVGTGWLFTRGCRALIVAWSPGRGRSWRRLDW